MKKKFLVEALVSLSMVVVFNSCSIEREEIEGGTGETLTATVENGSNYDEKIDNVKVLIGDHEVAIGIYSNGGFILELPGDVNAQYLKNVEAMFDNNDIPDGITVSKSGVKTGMAGIFAYKSDKQTGAFYHSGSNWLSFLVYAAEDVSITGSYTDEDGCSQKFNDQLKKGWNIVYSQSYVENNGCFYEEATEPPSGAKWYFDASDEDDDSDDDSDDSDDDPDDDEDDDPDDDDFSGVTGDCTWSITGTAGNYTLTISGNGTMANYDWYSVIPWGFYQNDIKTLVIESGVTSIGNYAFYYYNGLTGTLTIPNTVTSIGSYAFYYCEGFDALTIGNSVTSIGDEVFSYCHFTGTLTIPSSVTSIGSNAFLNCYFTVIINHNPVPQDINDNEFLSSDEATVLKVPAGSISAYQVAPGWSNIENIEAI
jgi:hypothetical protein